MKHEDTPDLFLEKLLLDELPREQKERLRQDPAVRRRLEELRSDNRRILDQYPAEQMAERIRHRSGKAQQQAEAERSSARSEQQDNGGLRPARSQRTRAGFPQLRWPKLVPAAGLATLVLVAGLLFLVRGPAIPGPGYAGQDVRLKGGDPHLNVYVQRESGPQRLEDGGRIREGDTIQVGYVSAEYEYGAILSIDGRGIVTVHFPLSAVTGQKLEGEGEVLLPFAYTLDDAPQFERFFFIYSKRTFDLQRVQEAAQKLAQNPEQTRSQNLKLPRGLRQSSLMLLK